MVDSLVMFLQVLGIIIGIGVSVLLLYTVTLYVSEIIVTSRYGGLICIAVSLLIGLTVSLVTSDFEETFVATGLSLFLTAIFYVFRGLHREETEEE